MPNKNWQVTNKNQITQNFGTLNSPVSHS